MSENGKAVGAIVVIALMVVCYALSQGTAFREWQCNQIQDKPAKAECLKNLEDK